MTLPNLSPAAEVHDAGHDNAHADAAPSHRDYLVFVRAGQRSLHGTWIDQDPERCWDCVVSWWGVPPADHGQELTVTGGLYKLDAFADFFETHRTLVASYRYVFIADDDLAFAPGAVSELLRTCDREKLFLTQPALRWRSWINHPITGRCAFTIYRDVSFIEMMAPVFSREALMSLIDTFLLTRSGSGVDWVWGHRLYGSGKVHVLDSVSVDHTRRVDPKGGALYKSFSENAINSWGDYQRMVAEFPIPKGIRPSKTGHRLRWRLPRWIGDHLVIAHWLFRRAWHRVDLETFSRLTFVRRNL